MRTLYASDEASLRAALLYDGPFDSVDYTIEIGSLQADGSIWNTTSI